MLMNSPNPHFSKWPYIWKETLTSKYWVLLEKSLSEVSKRNKNFRTREYMSVSFCYLINSTINAGCFSFLLANTPFVSSFKDYLQILISHDSVAMETVGLVKAPENEGWWFPFWGLQSRLQYPVHKECGTSILKVISAIPLIFYTSFTECYRSNLGTYTGTKRRLYKFV